MNFVSANIFLLIIFTIRTSSAFYCLQKSIQNLFHPIDCTKYYQCENGSYRILQCQPGHEFDRSSSKCQVMSFKGCVSKRLLNIVTPTCPKDQLDISSFPHDTECSKFYSCVNGVLTLMICLPGTEYNPEKGSCEIITMFGCTKSQKNYVTDVPISNSNTVISIPNGYQSDYWDDPISTSSEASTTEMSSDTTTTNEPTTLSPDGNFVVIHNTTNSPDPIVNACAGNSSGLIPHEKDCAKYYSCSNGSAQVLQCANGMEFNPITKVCENISSNGCSSKAGLKI